MRVPASLIADELHDFSADIARCEKGRLNLVDRACAKGREFRNVLILDGGNWKQSTADERPSSSFAWPANPPADDGQDRSRRASHARKG